MQIDVGLGPFRVNAVQTQEARKAKSEDFEIIPLVSNGTMKSGSISGELTAMDADNAFAGYIANMMFDLDFMLIEEEQRGGQTFSIIPFVQSDDQQPDANGGLSLVA